MPIHSELKGDVIFTNHTIQGDIENTNHSIGGDVVVNGAKAPPTYEGEYEVTPSENTQRLGTMNLMMDGDVIINPIPSQYFDTSDATATANKLKSGFSAYNSNGKIDGSYVYSWMGDDAEFVTKIYDEEFNLSEDTTYDSWTASTTAGSIKATANAGTIVGDMANYEYLILWSFNIDVSATSGATLKSMPIKECSYMCQSIIRRPGSATNIANKNFDSASCITLVSAPYMKYYDTSGAVKYTWSNSNGIYATVQAATFSSASSDTPTITIKTPVIYAKCSSSYFATGRKTQVDSANTDFTLKGEIYRVKKNTSALRNMYGKLVDIVDA